MKYLIRIDRDSIKKNPNAGRTSYCVPGRAEITLSFSLKKEAIMMQGDLYNKLQDLLGRYEVVNTRENLLTDTTTVEILATCCWEEMEDRAKEIKQELEKDGFTVNSIMSSVSRNIQQVHTLTPEPEYLYQFLETFVQCNKCTEEFSYKELIFNDHDDDDWSGNICPCCGSQDCCEIEYEKIKDVI